MCLMDLRTVSEKAPMKMTEWAMRRKGIREILVRSVMSLNKGAKTGLEWILSCQRSVRSKWECPNDLCCHLFFLQWW